MSGKTVAIVAAIGVGVFVLAKALVPRTIPPASKARSNTDLVGLAGLLSAAGSVFGSSNYSPTVSPAVIDTGAGLMATRGEWQAIQQYDAQGTPDKPVYGIAGLDY
jgi:hypothetical protein